jgi:hypothetical protein
MPHGTWKVPPELLPTLLAEFRTLSIAGYASLERPQCYKESVVLEVWRFPDPTHG